MVQNVLINLDFNGVSRIVNLPSPVLPTEPATKGYVDGAIEGLSWKTEVRVATNSNISLASPGATLDGVSMNANDRVLVMGQTNQYDNGIYIWNTSSSQMTRSFDGAVAKDYENAIVPVGYGSSAGSTFRQTATSIVLGTTNLVFGPFGVVSPPATTSTAGIAAIATQTEVNAGTVSNKIVTPATLASYTGYVRKFASTFGDGSATSYTITHNLGTQDVSVEVYRASGSYDKIVCEIDHTTVNVITLVFSSAPASNAFKVVVVG